MASLSKVILIGNLGSEPDVKYTPDGKAVTSFRIATNHRYTTSAGESREETDWFRVTVWGKQAESCNQFLTKGQQVYVDGRLHASNWQEQDGQMSTSLEVTADRVGFLNRTAAEASLPGEGELEPRDLPFDPSEGVGRVILIGNLGSDPEMRYTPSGKAVTSFRMATNRRYTTSAGESKEETDWFRITVWGRQAESCNQFLSKGRQVYVEGRLHARNWEGQDGQMRTSLDVTADRVLFLGRQVPVSLPEEGALEPGDLPFD